MMLPRTSGSADHNCVIFVKDRVDVAGEIVFEAADDLAVAQAPSGAPMHVRLGAAIITKPF